MIDFSKRDGRKRLEEIREAVSSGEFGTPNLLELVFLPIYGKETGSARSDITEEILRFESELYRSGKMPANFLAAAFVLSNKLIDKDRLKALWEDIKMLDILEIAKEEWFREGKMEAMREMLTDDLIERFRGVPARLLERVRTMRNPDALKVLHRQVQKCQNLTEFEAVMEQVL